jgi:hypothetical protein
MPSAARAPAISLISAVFATAVFGQPAAPDVVLRTANAEVVAGGWRRIADPSAAGGAALRHPDAGAPKLTTPLAAPANYFELSFQAEAGTPYRLWMRGRADADSWANDSIYAQFSASIDAAGTPIYRIGTSSATILTVEDCHGCGVRGWGWQDNGYGPGVLGPLVYFAATGSQTLRIQTREDGLQIDQIVLSPSTYLSSAPGATKNDTTILPASDPAAATLVHGPYLQQPSASSIRIVWATLQPGQGRVRYARRSSGAPLLAGAATRTVPRTVSGLAYDYFHHEASLSPLSAASEYDYELFLDDNPVGSAATYPFRTPPPAGTGPVTFIAFGDSGTGSAAQRQLAGLMAADAADLMLHTGDIAYGTTGGTGDASWKTFQDWFFAIYRGWLPSRPFFPSPGNHDSRPGNGNGRAYLDLFSLPANGATPAFPDHAERFYSFDYGPIHFAALDTEFAFQDAARRSEQLAWLDADLASTSQPWKVAFFHRSPFSAGGEHGSDLAVRDAFAPLFERHGVQLVLSAHEHDYERTHPQAIAGGPPVAYVVTGGGGAPLYAAAVANWTAYSASRHHYVRAVVDDCALRLEAIGLDGTVFDGTTLYRCLEPPPSAPDVVLYAVDAVTRSGAWTYVSDTTAAAGSRLRHPDAGAAKLTTPLAAPQHYVEFTFNASGGVPYRLWIRGQADANSWANDSVFVQFAGAVDSAGRPVYGIGTTSATTITIEDCTGCRLSGWGWQDNGYAGLGPTIRFAASGAQRIRIQTREDGLSIDQIVLSPERYLTAAPGALKNDTVIVPQVQ